MSRSLGRRFLRLAMVIAVAVLAVGRPAQAARSPHDGKAAGGGLTALAAMARAAAFGPRFLARVMANVASNETDVKAVLAKVVLGEADAGVVYVTDVTAQVAPRVRTIAIPTRFNQIAQYPIAVVAGSQNPALARKFVAYVLSSAGQSALRRNGFITTGTAGDPRPDHWTRAVSATVVGTP